MARHSKNVEFRSSTARELRDTDTVGSIGSLRLRVHGAKVDAYMPIRSNATSPPKFTGTVRNDGAGIAVAGQIRESFGGPVWPRGDAFVIVIMLVLVVFGVVGLTTDHSHGGLPPLLIGLIGGAVFAFRYKAHARRRRLEWRVLSDELSDELERYVAGG